MRGTVADMAVENNECGAAVRFPKDRERFFDAANVVGIADAQNIPSIRDETCLDVFGKGDARVAFDRDVIVVVNPAQIVETEMSRQGCRLRRYTFHQAPV